MMVATVMSQVLFSILRLNRSVYGTLPHVQCNVSRTDFSLAEALLSGERPHLCVMPTGASLVLVSG